MSVYVAERVKVSSRLDIRRIFSLDSSRNRLNQHNCTILRVSYVEDSIGQRIDEKSHRNWLLLSISVQ